MHEVEPAMLALVRNAWEKRLEKRGIGVDVNFFDFGGTSRTIAEVRADLSAELGREIPLVAFYRHQNIRAMARYLTGGGDASPQAGRARRPAPGGRQRALRGAARARRTEGDG
ncbi:Phosphopantetheine attachment site [Actinomadura meyerae]|uniref:Phosphopantetheine attachment site n=1 Tax=Actinomadura meyerae TaxID=240840 RepID=A0A239NVC6_9ACTN|nr:acyl carrier protein [Actinomadura meyerae]SNT58690.1 Phosphopantetheine attachment site [Actinomadura meyerae]